MSPADWAAVSLSGLTLIALLLQWQDARSRSHRAELAAAETRGEQKVVFAGMRESLVAFHKRQDDYGVALQLLREALLSNGTIKAHQMPPPSNRSRPPPPPNDVD